MNFLLPLMVGGPDIMNLEGLILLTSYYKTYHNADTDKKNIYLDNRGKSGIYMWVNNINGKRYVGSSVDLKRRFSSYYSVAFLTRQNEMQIHRALLKYGYSAFTLHILELCEKPELESREQHYLDLYKPEYNTLKLARSSFGFKQTEDSILRNILNQPKVMKITVTDLTTNITTCYDSMGLASRALGIDPSVIPYYFQRNQIRPYKNRYVFTLDKVE